MSSVMDYAKNSAGQLWSAMRPPAAPAEQGQFAQSQQAMTTLLGQAPTQMPDLTDPSVRQAHAAALLNAQLGETRQSTFLGGGQGLASAYGSKTLLGG